MPLPSIKVTKPNYSTMNTPEPRTLIEVPLKQKITQYIKQKKKNVNEARSLAANKNNA
jgi:hypothetical protein